MSREPRLGLCSASKLHAVIPTEIYGIINPAVAVLNLKI